MAKSNLPAVQAGIAAQLATATGIGNVLTKLSRVASNAPLLTIAKPRWRRIESTMGEMALEWTFEGTLSLPSENNERVEEDMSTAIINIIDVAAHDLDAHGSLPDGQFLIMSGVSDYGRIGDTPVYAHQFQIIAQERVLYEPSL